MYVDVKMGREKYKTNAVIWESGQRACQIPVSILAVFPEQNYF